jgi:hypothetical protein
VAEIARATGTNTPTSSRTSSNLAVRRCMSPQILLRRRREKSVSAQGDPFDSADNTRNSLQA